MQVLYIHEDSCNVFSATPSLQIFFYSNVGVCWNQLLPYNNSVVTTVEGETDFSIVILWPMTAVSYTHLR